MFRNERAGGMWQKHQPWGSPNAAAPSGDLQQNCWTTSECIHILFLPLVLVRNGSLCIQGFFFSSFDDATVGTERTVQPLIQSLCCNWLNVKVISAGCLWTTFLPGGITDLVVHFKLKPFNCITCWVDIEPECGYAEVSSCETCFEHYCMLLFSPF